MEPLRSLILAAADSDAIRRAVATAPGTRGIVARFVAGETVADALAAVRSLAADGRYATLDHLGENTSDPGVTEDTVRTYERLLDALRAEGLADAAEVSVKVSAVTVARDEELALRNARRICAAAQRCGTTVTIDMEDHTATDATLRLVETLRQEWPWAGAVLQSYLRRTPADAVALSGAGSRVRLCKGAYAEPADVAFTTGHETDLAYVRCANILLEGVPTRCSPRTIHGWWPCCASGRVGTGVSRAVTSTRCCTGSGRTSRSGWPRKGRPCVCTCRSVSSGTDT